MDIKPIRGEATLYMFSVALITNLIIGLLFAVVNTYLLSTILLVTLIVVDLYFLYYFFLDLTMKYTLIDNHIIIRYFWDLKKVAVNVSDIEGYMITKEPIHGVKLAGMGNSKFSYGRDIVDKIGTVRMFVSSEKNTLFFKTKKMCYAISPELIEPIEEALISCNIPNYIDEHNEDSRVELHKDKKFLILLSVVALIIILMMVIPSILYLRGSLPVNMPLSFDAAFIPIEYGSAKEFVFKQMIYGIMNMIILFCMYYAAYFCAKYDRKTAYRYLYISLIIVMVFFLIQVRILSSFGSI